ncbi:MAG TPA: 23S rRNA (pseudouridine(1915)-N(3))-methyltransferase RlmH [Xanthobacteraceae bacterium]|nr:23S rRNA (pseudouridine(1915)-N(3))-methyltransferase RlmH [Xanthobacteraceae bacterium]
MRLLIAAVGRLKAGPERELLDRYVERANAAGRAVSLGPLEISDIAESQDRRPQDRMADEARKLEAAVPKGAKRIVLDGGGRALKSEDFAARIAALRDQGAPGVVFLIGGADGLDVKLKSEAEISISYGAATFPHQIVRILLAEQIYRAITILSGHPYHRA